jgi:hypothetical protein
MKLYQEYLSTINEFDLWNVKKYARNKCEEFVSKNSKHLKIDTPERKKAVFDFCVAKFIRDREIAKKKQFWGGESNE